MDNNADHLYKLIADDLIKKINTGELKNKIGTEKELAQKYNVSRSTIRQALKELEKLDLIKRLLGKGTFVNKPSPNNNNFLVKAEQVISVIVPVISQDFIGNIITGIQEITSDHGYSINLSITDNCIEKEKKYLRAACENNVAGIILHPTNYHYYNEVVCEAIKLIPLIMTARYYRYLNCNYVVPDNFKGVYQATQYLIGLGHVNIGLVSDKPLIQTSIEDRILGFKNCINDNGIWIDQNLILDNLDDPCKLYSPNSTEESHQNLINRLISYVQSNKRLTAIMAINDYIARELIVAIKKIGLRIPGDISIIGFDNVILAKRTEPPLTTVNWSQIELGKVAARELIKIIENREENLKIKEILPVNLVKRDSTQSINRGGVQVEKSNV